MRVPGGGRVLSAALVRTMIHPVPLLLGSVDGPESIATATINSAGSVRTRMAWPATNMAVSPVRKTASSEYPLLRQPGCQVHHLTRGFADSLHRRGAFIGWGLSAVC